MESGEDGGELSVAALEATGLVKSFGSTRAVDKINLAVESGEFFALIGPS